jgi:LacI family transcriptional regulator
MGTEHLIDKGHQRIATIAGPERTTAGAERLEGYRLALRDAGTPVRPELVTRGDYHFGGGYDRAVRLCSDGSPPDSVFVANNLMAVGAISRLPEPSGHPPSVDPPA